MLGFSVKALSLFIFCVHDISVSGYPAAHYGNQISVSPVFQAVKYETENVIRDQIREKLFGGTPQYTPGLPQYTPGPPQYIPHPLQYTPGPPQYVPGPPQYTPGPPQYIPHPLQYTPGPPQYTPLYYIAENPLDAYCGEIVRRCTTIFGVSSICTESGEWCMHPVDPTFCDRADQLCQEKSPILTACAPAKRWCDKHYININHQIKSGILSNPAGLKKATIQAVKENIESETDEGKLFTAAKDGNLEAVKELLEAGVDVDSIDKQGRTALMYAAKFGQSNMTELLLNNSANIHLKDDILGWTLLHYAASEGHSDVLSALIYGENKLEDSQIYDMTAEKDINGRTGLHLASKNGHSDMLISLLFSNNIYDPDMGLNMLNLIQQQDNDGK
jgi:hypothetical protein